MSNNSERLHASEVLRTIELAEWQRLDQNYRGGFTSSISNTLIGEFNGSDVHLKTRYAEDGHGGLPTTYYSVTILRSGITIGELSTSYGADGRGQDPHALKDLFNKHLASFKIKMTNEASS